MRLQHKSLILELLSCCASTFYLIEGKCSELQFARGCRSVFQHEAIPYTFWKTNLHLCVKRLKNYNFYSSRAEIINPDNLPAKNCSHAQDYQIDLISVINCPITTIVNHTNSTFLLQQLEFSYEREDQYPIVEFDISEYDFCQNFGKDNISPGRNFNYILQKTTRQECSSFDQRTVLLDQQSELSLVQNNPRIENAISQLPDYPQVSDHYYFKLGYLRYPPWSYTCRTNSEYDLITTTDFLTLKEISPFLRSTVIMALVILCIQSLYIIYYCASTYLYLKQKQKQDYLYLKDSEYLKKTSKNNVDRDPTTETIKFVIMQLFAVTFIVILLFVYIKCSNHQDWYKNSSQCTDQLMSSYLLTYQQFTGDLMVIAFTTIFVTVGLVLLDFIHLLWRKLKGDLQEEDTTKTKVEESDLSISNTKNLVEITQDCLIANDYQINVSGNIEKDLLYQFDNPSPAEPSESCYSQNSSDKQA